MTLPTSIKLKQNIHERLQKVNGFKVAGSAAAALMTMIIGSAIYDRVGSAGDDAAAGREKTALEAERNNVAEALSRYVRADNDHDPSAPQLKAAFNAEVEKAAAQVVLTRNISSNDVADQLYQLNQAARDSTPAYVGDMMEFGNFAPLRLAQKIVLSRPGAGDNAATAQAVAETFLSLRNVEMLGGIGGLVLLAFAGVGGENLKERWNKTLPKQVAAALAANGTLDAVSVNEDGEIQASISLTLDRDIKVKPIRLSPKIRMFV